VGGVANAIDGDAAQDVLGRIVFEAAAPVGYEVAA